MERFFLRCLSAVVLLFSFGIVNAAYMDCPSAIAGSVTGAGDCEVSDDHHDFVATDPMTVNTDSGFFGIDTWSFIARSEGGDDGLGVAGNWNIPDMFWDQYNEIMMVFKDGNATTLVGYLLDDQATSGAWTSPFVPSVFPVSDIKEVSHISYYGALESTTNTPVPEPQTALLFGLGLIGLVYGRKRKTL
jgi:hypothetical protein